MTLPDPQDMRTPELLIRLDERTAAIIKELADLRQEVVTQSEFKPIRMLAYGLVALFMTGVIGAVLSVVLNQGGG